MSTQLDTLQLRLERTIRAPRERVFQAWTTNEDMQKWSAPEGMTIPEGAIDLRVGGNYRAVMVEPNGTRHVVMGTYREITPPSRLVYTHAWLRDGTTSETTPETIVTVEFHDEHGATRVVLTQEGFLSEDERNGHEEGWSSTLNRLAKLFDK